MNSGSEGTEPLVSVLVPAYNSFPYIEECVSSVLNQSYRNLEFIIVDDHSTDGTYEAISRLVAGDGRVTLLRNDPNLGAEGNFRRTLTLANGELIKWVCGDDVLRPDAIGRLVAAFAASPDIALATSRRMMIDEAGRAIQDMGVLQVSEPLSVFDGMEAGNLVLTRTLNWIGEPTTVLFRADLLPSDDRLYHIGSRRPRENSDVAWWLRLMAGRRIAYVDEPLSFFRWRRGQKTQDTLLQPDLVLSWYDLVLGAKEIGYLDEAAAEVQALSSLVALINSRVGGLPQSAREDVATVLRAIASRLADLTVGAR